MPNLKSPKNVGVGNIRHWDYRYEIDNRMFFRGLKVGVWWRYLLL
jgi:hypothetical protein